VNLPIGGLHLELDARVVHLWSDAPLAVLSSAVVGSELTHARHIVNLHVARGYDNRDPRDDLNAFARELEISEPFVGLLTAAKTERAQIAVERDAAPTVIAIATVGISHPTAAGITPAARVESDTINIVVVADACLAPAARVNAVITATEAKTLALIESGVRAPHGGFASGTGTDSIVIATTERGAAYEYAGPISPLGALIARAVRRAILDALCVISSEARNLGR
jgi:iron complex transport system ATP-binding protein